MFTVLSQTEIDAARKRLSYLYSSPYLSDQLTAVLMDTAQGEFGLDESIARQKVAKVLSWLQNIVGIEVPAQKEVK